ncbi:MAG: TonB-dependent receptor [Woeseiaceae bacterium]
MTLFNQAGLPLHSWRLPSITFHLAAVAIALLAFAAPASAQQSGDIAGQVTDATGTGLGGVTVEASSNVLPQPRSTTTAANGRYRIRLLPPGTYDVEFTFADGSTQTREILVLLQQTAVVDIVSGDAMEEIVVTGEQMALGATQGSLGNAISAETIDAIPTGQDYRDMMKLIPGVQYTEFDVRGPSAGGSGQDNIYQFDGVDVSLPLFGVLGSEPSSHDIAQITIVRGGAKAIGFNRSGGFTMNTISKRGTDEFRAEVGYQLQSAGMTGDQDVETDTALLYDEDRSWITANFGGPLIRDRLYFYTSFYRPERSRANSASAYGDVGDYESVRDEYFGKLTFSATEDILLDLSYRTSERNEDNAAIGGEDAPSTSRGDEASQDMLIFEGTWNIGDDSALSVKYVDWEESGKSAPDNQFSLVPQEGASLNVGSLDEMGFLNVPTYRDENDGDDDLADAAFNSFVQPIIDTYSYATCAPAEAGCGGGYVGGYFRSDEATYTRESFEIAFDHTLYFGDTTHDLHFGYKFEDIDPVAVHHRQLTTTLEPLNEVLRNPAQLGPNGRVGKRCPPTA